MASVFRPATANDLSALYQMTKSAGIEVSKLSVDRDALAERIAQTAAAMARGDGAAGDGLFLFVLEHRSRTGGVPRLCGTCRIVARVGLAWPFYNFRMSMLTQSSEDIGHLHRTRTLELTTDLEGSSEIAGLYLPPSERATGCGALLARAGYLFMAEHRSWFAARTIAELPGFRDQAGRSPFWDEVTGQFFGMSLNDADRFSVRKGTQFIGDLMPKHPLYFSMLPRRAQAAIGVPHDSSRVAMRMLEAEGFIYESYMDIFDGGPTMTAATDRIRTVRDAVRLRVEAISPVADGVPGIVAAGRRADFRASMGLAAGGAGDGGIVLDPACAVAIGARIGDTVLHVPR